MDDFLSKMKKKLSVDNILDLMKDGKLKEEIKQTLTAGVNLNEKPNPDNFRPCLEAPSLEHTTEEGQTTINLIENSEKPGASANLDHSILEPVTHVTVENVYHETPDGIYRLSDKGSEEKLKDTTSQPKVELNEQNVAEEKVNLKKEDTNKQFDEKEPDGKKLDDGMNVLQKTPQQENEDLFDFEMFLG